MSMSEVMPPPVSVELIGDIDLAAVDEIRSLLQSGAEAACREATDMEVDLARVTFLDSTGLNSLLGVALLLDRAGLGLVLRSVPVGVRRLLDVAGVGRDRPDGDVALAPLR
jgi:anti-anti-sigma factor